MKPILVESFLTPAEAQALLASVQSLPWTRGRFMGRAVPREEVWMGPYAYKFSGRMLVPAPWRRKLKPSRLRSASNTAAITIACSSIATRMSRIASPGIPTANRNWIHAPDRISSSAPHANFWSARSRARTLCNRTSSLPEAFSSCPPDFSRDTSTASRNRRHLALSRQSDISSNEVGKVEAVSPRSRAASTR